MRIPLLGRGLRRMRGRPPTPRTPFEFIDAEHFSPNLDHARAVALFKRSVVMVEIETFSYCNRTCWFCPNASIDRRSINHRMDPKLYLGILKDLQTIDYDQVISYSRYNEPLADKVILERIETAARMLPKAMLHTNTNGDYLTFDYLEKLYAVGLRSLGIQIYAPNSGGRIAYDESWVEEAAQKKIEKLGLPSSETMRVAGEHLEWKLEFEDMKIRLYARNFEATGTDRGGMVDIGNDPVRSSPCLSPFHHVYVDYNGKMMPCCNLRSDADQHLDYVVGDLADEEADLFDLYAAKELASWRSSLIGFTPKSAPCDSCRFVVYEPDAANSRANDRLVELANSQRPRAYALRSCGSVLFAAPIGSIWPRRGTRGKAGPGPAR